MKFAQMLVCCMTNISNMLLAESWRLETTILAKIYETNLSVSVK